MGSQNAKNQQQMNDSLIISTVNDSLVVTSVEVDTTGGKYRVKIFTREATELEMLYAKYGNQYPSQWEIGDTTKLMPKLLAKENIQIEAYPLNEIINGVNHVNLSMGTAICATLIIIKLAKIFKMWT